ncbi:hypothetical protein TIFTF001_006360 [Ficus carica]|uniref:DUF4220 domain-containing protein n=1 Tax=Ficus carica TaxID=3494 RepID=A0AA88A3Y3_FICCA|nr:hypothetical protein TIFTF001_006360 [Ficus carica]
MLWLSKNKNVLVDLLCQAISSILPSKTERWSNEIAQYNLLRFSLKDKPAKCRFLQRVLGIYELMEKYRYKRFIRVPKDLKELIFQQLRKKSARESDFRAFKALCAHRGQGILENEGCLDDFSRIIEDAEFDQGILLWHIATDLCYYTELDENLSSVRVKGDRSKSVLFDACRLAKELNLLESKPEWNKEKKWKLISNVWVEMLSYAASQCQANQHAQQLRKGGELLTHVWLLLAHLGITEQFQISKGHARAKLIAQ